MSRLNTPTSRSLFASKTAFEALVVDSGEESEEEVVDEQVQVQEPAQLDSQEAPQPPVVVPAPQPPTDSTKQQKQNSKKTSRAARNEKKQRPPKAKESNGQPAPVVEVEPSLDVPQLPKTDEPATTKEDVASVDSVIDSAPPEQPLPAAHEVSSSVTTPQVEVSETLPLPVPSKPIEPLNGASNQPVVVTQNTPAPSQSPQDQESVKKRQNALTRILWTFIMIGGFIGLLLLGHAYMVLLVMLCQTLVYREVTALFSLKTAKPESADAELTNGKDPWSKTLNWYFFAVTNYFLYGESIIYYFKHVVFADANLLPFATNHRMISFTLYIIGFMGFVMSLKKGYLKQQFGLFCWVHMSLLLIVMSSHFIVNNILEGLIWFWVPASLVICNDCFAYIWGITVGRTPLIKLSPKKTVEGFVGAFISTVIFAVLWGTYFMRFHYMICPVHDLGVSAWNSIQCTPNPVFIWRSFELWKPVAAFLQVLTGKSITHLSYAPYQLHLLVLACFASLVAPFGGFFASGFKRAFNIKDFGHSIPGHGGMTDRMDCQFLMGIFTYVYYSSLIRVHQVTVGGVLQTIVSSLTIEQQLELISDLSRYLEKQGIVIP
ncbi:hypothetical protein CVT24_003971 [Panaeolus cyanescens]|uniref:Phosphatidate cytidylyltransferase n=1 Tax=Panaeolus cyanescens TaxID=181874 RepID=A0A409Y6R3_9AGAR|nr:hypothetical protein CVT24_003971 [Panaeolus cyanescens]